ncbi:aminoacyl-tRNA hydrolase [Candidatus Riflebacteria bacterium]
MMIVGLGNPGPSYVKTRHNIGFQFLDFLADKNQLNFKNKKNFAYSVLKQSNLLDYNKHLLIKPLGYMNLSGEAVIAAKNYFKVGMEEIIVVCDDANLELGKVRFRQQGSCGGQKGLKNIIHHLKSSDFARLRIGISGGNLKNLSSYVLGRLKSEEERVINKIFVDLESRLENFSEEGLEQLMNYFNGNFYE